MGKKKDGHWTGIASEHLVLSMLYRLGAKAYLTLGNEKSIDIRITKDDGSWISVDVKSVRKWDSIPVGNAVGKDNHYYVFVIYNNKFSDLSVFPEFYIVPSDIVVERRKEFNGGPIDIFKKDIADYKDKWDILGNFGDIPWYSSELNTTDEDMYKARDKRSVVVDSIMNMLDQAVEHLKLRSAVGVNRLNKESALIYKSRVALFEATWAKYHKGTPSASDVDANKYFQKVIDAYEQFKHDCGNFEDYTGRSCYKSRASSALRSTGKRRYYHQKCDN